MLLPPSLILATWYWTTTSPSLLPASVTRPAFTTLALLGELDSDLARLYSQLGLSKSIRQYPPELTDRQKRRFAALRAPLKGDPPRTGDQPPTGEDDRPDRLDSTQQQQTQDQTYYLTSNLLNAAPVLVSNRPERPTPISRTDPLPPHDRSLSPTSSPRSSFSQPFSDPSMSLFRS